MDGRRLLTAALPADVTGYAKIGTGFFQHVTGVVADAARNHVFALKGNSTLLVIDTDTSAQIASIPLSDLAESIAITPDGSAVLAAEPYAHKVEVISTATLTSQRILNTGVPLIQVAGGAGGKFYGVASTDAALASSTDAEIYGSQSVVQFDLVTGTRGATLDAPNTSTLFVHADSRGERLYVGSNAEVGYYGDGQDAVFAYDVSNPAAIVARDTLPGSNGKTVDLFDDRVAGQLYLADADANEIDVVHADGTVAHWAADFGGNSQETLTGLAGLPGSGVLFATFDEDAFSPTPTSLVAFDTATGAVRHVYSLYHSSLSSQYAPAVAVTANGRVTYAAVQLADVYPDSEQTYGVGIVGAATLQIPGTDNVVVGEVFHDANHDGVRQSGEDDWFDADADGYFNESDVIVYADLNGNGVLDASAGTGGDLSGDEPYTTISSAGRYRLELPTAAGTYTICLQTGSNYSPHLVIFPTAQASRTVTLSDGQQLTGVSFGVEQGVEVAGTVFADLDGNGVYDHEYGGGTGEPTVGGAQVYLDLNRDGQRQSNEPLRQVGDDGTYSLTGWFDLTAPASGPAVVRLLNPKGYVLTTPASVAIDGAPGEYDEVDFGIRPQLAVSGTLFNDANANGKRDAGETPWVGARVWLDLDGNGKFTKGEPTARTTSDGAYAFAVRERGTWPSALLARDATAHPLAIAQKSHGVLFTDWKQTVGGDLGAYAPSSLSLAAFLDLDKNRKHSKRDRWLAGTVAFIDRDNDGKQDKNERSVLTDDEGHATFADLAPGTYTVRLRVSSRWGKTTGTSFTVTLGDGQSASLSAAVRVG